MLDQAKAALPKSFGEAKNSAVKYSKFVLEHVKKGEMPWTQWYCCGVVDGHEVSLQCLPSFSSLLFMFLFANSARTSAGRR